MYNFFDKKLNEFLFKLFIKLDSAIPSTTNQQSNFVNISINKVSATVLAKMLVRTLIILLWADDRQKIDKKAQIHRKRKFNEIENLSTNNESEGK